MKNVLGYSEELDIALLETTKSNSTAVETCTSVTTGETVYGEKANFRIDAILNQNKVIAIYFEKLTEK